eukprot:1203359-Amphidinium_carterae.1
MATGTARIDNNSVWSHFNDELYQPSRHYFPSRGSLGLSWAQAFGSQVPQPCWIKSGGSDCDEQSTSL